MIPRAHIGYMMVTNLVKEQGYDAAASLSSVAGFLPLHPKDHDLIREQLISDGLIEPKDVCPAVAPIQA